MKINVHSLAFKQSVTVLVSISIVFAVLFGIGGFQINEKLSQMLLQKGEEISRANVALINNLFSSGKSIGEEISVKVGTENLAGQELRLLVAHAFGRPCDGAAGGGHGGRLRTGEGPW